MSSDPFLLGVRHHGPGSARAVTAALEHLKPDTVLIEGPPEADGLLVHTAGLTPPVAVLIHAVDQPSQAGFWPFAAFSPEWAALSYAAAHDVPVRFIDLPASYAFALDRAREDAEPVRRRVADPIGSLAAAAGYDDPERWWEDVVEHRHGHDDPLAPFVALGEAMAALREDEAEAPEALNSDTALPDTERVREAHMRLEIRAARRAGHNRIAVVCGAWHVPALQTLPPVTADRAVLAPFAVKGAVGRVKTEATWVPWTHRRLSQSSGYGAGVESPGWYSHLYETTDRPLPRWFVRIAALLRDEGFPVSSAHVIEAVRHAETLAVLRGRPLAGLDETWEAVRAVMCDGDDTPLALVRERIIVGDRIGEVPDSVPAVPLQRDLAREQKRLRLKPEAAEKTLELDLRKDNDADRSRLLARLVLLDIPWGTAVENRRGTGTFRETWRLHWEPELAIRIAEAGVWGTTVTAAASTRAAEVARNASSLAEVTAVAERCLHADLPTALPVILQVLGDRAALDTDISHLAEAVPALARALRYGDVRGTDTSALATVVDTLLQRISIGLVPACAGLDNDGAKAVRGHLDDVHATVNLVGADQHGHWFTALERLADRDDLPGLLTGRATRLLLDSGRLSADDAAPRMSRALSRGTEYRTSASWLEGFLSGGGLLLIHDEKLLKLIDDWVTEVPDEDITSVLPLLRRTFATYAAPERRTLGELLKNPQRAKTTPVEDPDGFDQARADAVLPTLALILGAVE